MIENKTPDEIRQRLREVARAFAFNLLMALPILGYTAWVFSDVRAAEDWALIVCPIVCLAMLGFLYFSIVEWLELRKQLRFSESSSES